MYRLQVSHQLTSRLRTCESAKFIFHEHPLLPDLQCGTAFEDVHFRLAAAKTRGVMRLRASPSQSGTVSKSQARMREVSLAPKRLETKAARFLSANRQVSKQPDGILTVGSDSRMKHRAEAGRQKLFRGFLPFFSLRLKVPKLAKLSKDFKTFEMLLVFRDHRTCVLGICNGQVPPQGSPPSGMATTSWRFVWVMTSPGPRQGAQSSDFQAFHRSESFALDAMTA